VVGDCALDVTVARGDAEPELSGGDTIAHISLGPGGQAANLAVRLARAGVPTRLVAPLADDAAGGLLVRLLAAERIELVRLPADRTSVVIALLDTSGERSMQSDRAPITATAVRPLARALAGCRWMHVSGYALRDATEAERVSEAVAGHRAGSPTRVSIAGGSVPSGHSDALVLANAIERIGVDLLIVNLAEAHALLGGTHGAARDPIAAAAAAAEALATGERLAVVTAGLDGSAAAGAGLADPLPVPAETLPGPVIDTTGAGDAYAAGMIGVLRLAEWPPGAASIRAALRAGSRLGGLVARASGAQARVAGEADPLP
jgi:sugar/nucleoside kinase (ribokinase family)